MNFSATTKWIALALLGLAISAAVAAAASNLVSRQIGIASESVSAGDALAPAVETAARQNRAGGKGSDNGAPATEPESIPSDGDSGTDDGRSAGTKAEEDRLDELEDAQKDREDALEDALDEREDAREDALKELEDNSGHGSDD